MKKLGIVAVAGLLGLMVASVAWTQPAGGPGGRGGGMHYGMMWDAGSVTTVSGEVTAVEKYTPGKGGSSYGLRLTVKTDKETLPVILGPGWYIEQQAFAVAARDKVEVKGSRILVEGQPMIIAAEVKKGDQMLKIRDDKGIPLWAGPK